MGPFAQVCTQGCCWCEVCFCVSIEAVSVLVFFWAGSWNCWNCWNVCVCVWRRTWYPEMSWHLRMTLSTIPWKSPRFPSCCPKLHHQVQWTRFFISFSITFSHFFSHFNEHDNLTPCSTPSNTSYTLSIVKPISFLIEKNIHGKYFSKLFRTQAEIIVGVNPNNISLSDNISHSTTLESCL